MPFLFFSGWHSFITAKQSIIFDKSDMTIAEKVSHSGNRALFTLFKEGLFYRLSCKYLKPSDYQSEGFFLSICMILVIVFVQHTP